MFWNDASEGSTIHNNCHELFNCSTNTVLDFHDMENYIKRYDYENNCVAFVVPKKTGIQGKYAVIYFDGPKPDEFYGYNIGYVNEIPSKEEIGLRIGFLQHQADKEWRNFVFSGICFGGRNACF